MELRTWLANTSSLSSKEVNKNMRDCDSLADLALLMSEDVRGNGNWGNHVLSTEEIDDESDSHQGQKEVSDDESNSHQSQKESTDDSCGEEGQKDGEGQVGSE